MSPQTASEFYSGEVKNKQDLFSLYQRFLSQLSKKELILLQGPVGVGKTESLKMWSQILGLRQVASPSFAIHHCYSNDQGLQIDHVDLYRTETEDDIDSTGFWDLFSADSGWVVVEWPERISQQHWPLSWSRWLVQMDFANAPDSRSIKIIKQNSQATVE